MVFALARKHRVDLKYPSVDALRRAYAFDDLQSFLDLYYAGRVLRDEGGLPRDDEGLPRARRADGVVHAEIFFDPQTHTARGFQ